MAFFLMHLSSSLKSTCPLKPGDLSKRKPVLSLPCLYPLDGSLAVVIGINRVSTVIQVLHGWSRPLPPSLPCALALCTSPPVLAVPLMVPCSLLTQALGTWHSLYSSLTSQFLSGALIALATICDAPPTLVNYLSSSCLPAL